MGKKNKFVLVTGSDGLVGSESVRYYSKKGYSVIGIDNNSRKKFFGDEASVLWNRKSLKQVVTNYISFNRDITNKELMEEIFNEIIHLWFKK